MEGFQKCIQRFNTFDEEEILSILDQTLLTGVNKIDSFFCEYSSSILESEIFKKFLETCCLVREKNYQDLGSLEPFTCIPYESELDLTVQIKNVACYILAVNYYQGIHVRQDIKKAVK